MNEQTARTKGERIEAALTAFFNAESLEMGWEVFQNHPELLNGEGEAYLNLLLELLPDEDKKQQVSEQLDFLSRNRLNYIIKYFLELSTWSEAVQYILKYPDLLTEGANLALQGMENYFRNQGNDIQYADFLADKRKFIDLCRETGVEEAYASIVPKDDFLNALLTFIDVEEWQETRSFLQSNPYLLSNKAIESIDTFISLASKDNSRPVLMDFTLNLHRQLLEQCRESGMESVFSNPTNPAALYRVVKKLEAVYRKYGQLENELDQSPEIFTQEAELFVNQLLELVTDEKAVAFFRLLKTLQADLRVHGKDIAYGRMKLRTQNNITQERVDFMSKVDSVKSLDDLLEAMISSPSVAKDFLELDALIGLENLGEEANLPNLSLPEDDPYAKVMAESHKVPLDIVGQIIGFILQSGNPQELPQRIHALETVLNRLDRQTTPYNWALVQNLYGQLLTRMARDNEMLEKAIKAHQAALEIFTKEETPVLWALIQNDLGMSYYERVEGDKAENFDKAIDAFTRALEIRTREQLPNEWVDTSGNLASAHMMRLGSKKIESIEKAIQIFNEVLHINTKKDRPEYWAGTQNNLGLAWMLKASQTRDQNERNSALTQSIEHFKNALIFYSESALPIDWGMAKLNLGNSLRARNLAEDHELTIEVYSDALKVFTLDEFPQAWAKTNIGLAYLHQSKGSMEKAIEIYTELTSACNNPHLNLFRFISAGLLGVIYNEQEQWQLAYDYLKMSIQTLELLRFDAFTEDTRLFFNKEPGEFFKYMVETCIKLGSLREAFENIEASKSRLFLEQLATDNSFLPPSVSTGNDLIEMEQVLLHELRIIEKSLRQTSNFQSMREALARQETIVESLDTLWDKLEKKLPDYVMLRRGAPARYETILAFLNQTNRKVALVEYFDLFGKIIVFVIRPDQQEPIYIETGLTNVDIRKAVRQYFGNILKKDQFDEEQYWLDLSSNLFGKIIAHLGDIDTVYLVPHGDLHLIPFYAIRVAEQSIVELFTLVSSPSATILERIHRRNANRVYSSSPQALVFGNPTVDLPYSLGEAQDIAKILNTVPCLGSRATKKVALQEGPDKDILHFACHGYFDPERPMDSGIILADGEPLMAKEIMNLPLHSDLVTLSACLTGLNKVEDGDELSGLTRAFLYAGASSVLVSLWPIHDKITANFMIEFYQRLANKNSLQSKSEILREVILSIRSKQPQPYFWAPFTLIGNL